jgi:hypothetical protein
MSRSGNSAVFLAGLATTGAATDVTAKWNTNPIIRRLSASLAPAGKRIFATVANANTWGRVDVSGTTNITWAAGGAGRGWVSLDSIVYNVGPQVAPNLTSGWANYDLNFERVGHALDNGAVYVTGLAKAATYPKGKAIFTLPVDQRPAIREVFFALANNNLGRVDVTAAGQVLLATSTAVGGWASLSNVHFRPASAVFTKMPLANYWVTLTGFAPASANLGVDGRVFLRGMMKSGRGVNFGTLPAKFRPTARRTFIVACNTGACRVDIQPTGVVSLVGKKYGVTTGAKKWPGWVSLSGIAYDLTPDTTAA